MDIEKKKLAESVYNRLKNIALKKKRPTQEILVYYAMERFLYRLSLSQHKNSFFLKGGLMLKVWNPDTHRATMDIDLLAKAANSIDTITRIIREICDYSVQPDGIIFQKQDIRVVESQIETEYIGLSARFSAQLFTAKLPMRLDVGFSDKIFPKPAELSYPTLLDFPQPQLRGYTPETMIAEKIDAIIKLGFVNTRMKDFYDIWLMLNRFQIQPETMKPILQEVLSNRKTIVDKPPHAFSEAFYKSPRTIERWEFFLKNIGEKNLSLEDVILSLQDFFLPILPLQIEEQEPS